MADQADKSDDLIAELAKLMASNAQGPEGRGPATVKVAGPGTPAQPRPSIRIPGMDGPMRVAPSGPVEPAAKPAAESTAARVKAGPAPVAPKPQGPVPAPPQAAPPAPNGTANAAPVPGIRIPGMEPPPGVARPVPATQPQPAASTAPAAKPAPAPVAAVGAKPAGPPQPPISSAPGAKPSPMPTNSAPRPGFGSPAVNRPPGPGTAVPAGVVPPRPGAPRVDLVRFDPPKFEGFKSEPAKPEVAKAEASEPEAQNPARAEAPRPEPKPADGPAAIPMPPPMMTEPAQKPAAPSSSFDFDFGFGTKDQAAQRRPEPKVEIDDDQDDDEPEVRPTPASTDKPRYDPIAALIAAELDAAEQATDAPMPELDLSGLKAPSAAVRPLDPVIPPRSAAPRPVRPPESDRFVEPPITAPVASIPEPRRAPPQPVTDLGDPMAEIESLIGEAVRVDLSPQQAPHRPAPQPAPVPNVAPVVPPLNSQFPPRRSVLKEDAGVQAAEQAIAAAAAQTSRRDRAAEERAQRRARQEEEQTEGRRSPLRPLLGFGLAASLLVAAGAGVYWVIGMGPGDTAAPMLTAEATPAKIPPAQPAASASAPPSSVVFERLEGVQASAAGEQLVTRDETQSPEVARVVDNAEAEATTGESELASRRVRTVTVRPDGTIVTAENAVAGTSELPVERPNVPNVPGAPTQPSDLLVAAGNPPAARTILPSAGSAAATPAPGSALALMPTQPAPSATRAGYTINPSATVNSELVPPVVAPRIGNREQRLASITANQSNPVTAVVGQPGGPQNLFGPSPTPQPAASIPSAPVATGGGSAPAYVQLMSLPTEAEARQQAGIAQQRWGSLFNGQGMVIQRAELTGGRVTYRLRLPASSLQNATQICATIKSNGGDCFATNG